MKKGLIFSITVFFLFTSLLVISNSNNQIGYPSELSLLSSTDKVYYVFYNVKQNVMELLQIMDIEIDGDSVIIHDRLPAETDIVNHLREYEKFVNDYFESNLVITFLDAANNPINLENIDPTSAVTLYSSGVTYGYLDFGKNELRINGADENKPAEGIESIFINITVMGEGISLKTDPPTWSPDKPCSPPASDTCLHAFINVTDTTTTFLEERYMGVTKQSAVSYSTNPNGWVKIQFGVPSIDGNLINVDFSGPSEMYLYTDITFNMKEENKVLYPLKLNVSMENLGINKEAGLK
jgi:hypothetical protein